MLFSSYVLLYEQLKLNVMPQEKIKDQIFKIEMLKTEFLLLLLWKFADKNWLQFSSPLSNKLNKWWTVSAKRLKKFSFWALMASLLHSNYFMLQLLSYLIKFLSWRRSGHTAESSRESASWLIIFYTLHIFMAAFMSQKWKMNPSIVLF